MAYVPVPKDLSKSQNKSRFQSDKAANRFFCVALLIGLPLFFLLKDSAGTSLCGNGNDCRHASLLLGCHVEKHGQPPLKW